MIFHTRKLNVRRSLWLVTLCTLGLYSLSLGVEQKSKPKVTFVELGSVRCIPCKAMKEIMDKLEAKFPRDLDIVFHDVWTDAGKPAARKYQIRSIPTQVFLDENGQEFYRHEGYFPQDELEKILLGKGVMK